MLGGLGPMEILLILVAVALIFGAKRLPEMGANLGKGIKNFKKSFSEAEDDGKQLSEGKSEE
jgi:sec-independent protein translocase protein TatA